MKVTGYAGDGCLCVVCVRVKVCEGVGWVWVWCVGECRVGE